MGSVPLLPNSSSRPPSQLNEERLQRGDVHVGGLLLQQHHRRLSQFLFPRHVQRRPQIPGLRLILAAGILFEAFLQAPTVGGGPITEQRLALRDGIPQGLEFFNGAASSVKGRILYGHSRLVRSEERRVGKECRSRW